MAAQDVRELIPRVRRAVEGPIPATTDALTDAQVEAMAADAIGDVILLTVGAWQHRLLATDRDGTTNVPTHWSVDPGLELEEEGVIAAQAAITFFFHEFRDQKVSETITNEATSWEYTLSATLIRDQIKLLQDQRDAALKALLAGNPVLARYASILAVRDRVGAAMIEPYTVYGSGNGVELGGGMERGGNVWLPAP